MNERKEVKTTYDIIIDELVGSISLKAKELTDQEIEKNPYVRGSKNDIFINFIREICGDMVKSSGDKVKNHRKSMLVAKSKMLSSSSKKNRGRLN